MPMAEQDQNPQTTLEPQKITPDLKPLPLKYEAFEILKANGLNQSDAARAIGLSKSSGTLISKKLNSLSPRYDLTSKNSVKLAAKAHRKILGCFVDPNKNINDSSIDIKGSDVTKAIDRVYDRVQPTIQRNLNVNLNLDHPVDLEKYL